MEDFDREATGFVFSIRRGNLRLPWFSDWVCKTVGRVAGLDVSVVPWFAGGVVSGSSP